MEKIYRYRSEQSLLNFKELENSNIYFSDLESLNDPLEGKVRLCWKGDFTLWKNLFKHYILVLSDVYFQHLVMNNNIKNQLCPEKLKIHLTDGYIKDTVFEDVYRAILTRCFNDEYIKLILEDICKIEQLDSNMLTVVLMDVQGRLLYFINEVYIEFRFMGLLQFPIKLSDKSGYVHYLIESNERDVQCAKSLQYLDSLAIKSYCNEPQLMEDHDLLFLSIDFPKVYIQRLIELVCPPVYTASFSKIDNSSTMWAHYANNHRGVCLIFEINDDGYLEFKDSKIRAIKVEDVKYQNDCFSLEFFTHIRYALNSDEFNFWYNDGNGELNSYIKKYLEGINNRTKLLVNTYAEIFTRKMKDWSYEQERRLFLIDYQLNEHARALKYDKNCLKGIIFGMNMSTSEKCKIMNLAKENYENLEFYQSYYNESRVRIDKYKISE